MKGQNLGANGAAKLNPADAHRYAQGTGGVSDYDKGLNHMYGNVGGNTEKPVPDVVQGNPYQEGDENLGIFNGGGFAGGGGSVGGAGGSWGDEDEQTSKKITENAQNIVDAAEYYGVDPKVVAGVIYTEQALNVNFVDTLTDWVAHYGLMDMSVGLGQVRMTTAEFIEEQGYVTKESLEEYGLDMPIETSTLLGLDTKARYARLNDDRTNCLYAAAYIKYFQDAWEEEYPEIKDHPEILMTLYNLGHDITEPNNSPGTNPFGDYAMEYYDMMGYFLTVD